MVRRESVKGISNANEPDWLMEQIAQYRGGLHPSRTQHSRPGGHRTVSWVIRTRPFKSRQPQITRTQERRFGKTTTQAPYQRAIFTIRRHEAPDSPSSESGSKLPARRLPSLCGTHRRIHRHHTMRRQTIRLNKSQSAPGAASGASICSVELAVRAFAPLRVNRDSWPSRTTIAPWRCPAPHPWPGCDRARRDHRSRRA